MSVREKRRRASDLVQSARAPPPGSRAALERRVVSHLEEIEHEDRFHDSGVVGFLFGYVVGDGLYFFVRRAARAFVASRAPAFARRCE